MLSVHDLLNDKGYEIWSTKPDSSVFEALQLLAEQNVGALLVFEAEELLGIFSERDYARKVLLKGKFSKDTPVREVMTTGVFTVSPDDSIEQCMDMMTKMNVRHLPVLQAGRVVGIISIGDIVRKIISEQRSTINMLERSIAKGCT